MARDMVILKELFKKLEIEFDIRLKSESISGDFFKYEYSSINFIIEIEQYSKEIYVSLYSSYNLDKGVNLYNLLEFIIKDKQRRPIARFYHYEQNVNTAFKLQLEDITKAIHDNFDLIDNFFKIENYNNNFLELDKFWRQKHPEFYVTQNKSN